MSSEKTLLEVTSLIADCPHSTPEWTTTGVVVLRNQHIKAGRLQLNAPSYTDEKHYLQRVRRAKPTYKDIVLTREAPIGQLCQVPKGLKCCLGQRQVLIRADTEQIDPDFLFYSLRAPFMQRQMLLIEGEGTTVSNLRIPYIEKLKLTVPSPETQKNVVRLLNAIEGEIETLERQNSALESIAQTLFRSWFVDFDPVHAKLAGNEPEAMSAELAALFPSEFENSELGLIPKGWAPESLDKRIDYLNGLPLQKFPPIEGEATLPVIKISQLKAGRGDHSILANRRMKPAFIVKDGDIIFSWSGSLALRIWTGGDGALNQHLFKVSSKSLPHWFCFQATLLHLASFQETAASKATTMGHIQRHHLTEAKVAVPPEALLGKMSSVFSPLFKSIVINGQLIKGLEQLRDHLLPRLISGKLRIEDAEASVAAITSELEAEPA